MVRLALQLYAMLHIFAHALATTGFYINTSPRILISSCGETVYRFIVLHRQFKHFLLNYPKEMIDKIFDIDVPQTSKFVDKMYC